MAGRERDRREDPVLSEEALMRVSDEADAAIQIVEAVGSPAVPEDSPWQCP